jgi:YebC/PmpR family DNA-binding regulatory protein
VAGHSKWANIKHRKAAKDSKKGVSYAKCSRELMMAAKIGGDDPSANFRLRTAIDRAKAAGLPNDTIQRAVDKGAGKLDADNTETVIYEGYGPGGVAIYIETMTDNRNRTVGDIRSYFNKCEGNLGSDGCVAWMFKEQGLIQVSPAEALYDAPDVDEKMFDAVVNAGGEDISRSEAPPENVSKNTPVFDVMTEPNELNAVCDGLTQAGCQVHSAELIRVPENDAPLTDMNHIKLFMKLYDAIDGHDDVQSVYSNESIDDALLEQLED